MFFRYLLVGLVTMAAFLRLVDVPDAFALESVSSPTTAQKGYVTR